MSPKYSTQTDGDDEATRWTADTRHVLAEWSSKPFVGHRHRHETVEHRIVVEYTHGVGCDVLHECRSEDTEKIPDDWVAVETIEARDYAATHDRAPETRWLS